MTTPNPDPTPLEQPAPSEPIIDPATAPEAQPEDESSLPEWAREKLRKVNREAQNLRTRLHESEPLIAEATAAREAQKTEAQRATERANALEAELATARLEAERNALAAQHNIPPTHFKYIVGGSQEERAESAQGIADMLRAAAAPQITPPPTNRPNAVLRPGASPATQDNSPPTAYPPEWIPKRRPRETQG